MYISNRDLGIENSVFIATVITGADFCTQEVDSSVREGLSAIKPEIVNKAAEIQKLHVHLSSKQGFKGRNVIGLDSMAEISIFKKEMVIEEYPCDPVLIYGVNKSNEPIYVKSKGISVLGIEVYVSESTVGNILSFADARDQGHAMKYDDVNDRFKLQLYENGEWYEFDRGNRDDNLYLCDVNLQRRCINITTVAERLKLYTKREISQALRARQIQRRLGFVSRDKLIKMLGNGHLLQCDIGKRDVMRAEDIFGQDIGELKGKSTYKKAPHVTFEDKIHENVQIEEQEAHCDLMFLNGKPFLVSVFLGTEYVMVNRIKTKGSKDLMPALKKQISEMVRQGFKITSMRSDGESGIVIDKDSIIELNNMGIKVDVVSPGDHVPVVERKIRTIKEKGRCLASILPFELNSKLEDLLVKWAVSRINMDVTTNSSEYISPREKVYNVKVDVLRETKYEFGEYVQVFTNIKDSTNKDRSRGAIAIMPTGNRDGSWYFYALDNGGIFRKRRGKALPMPDEVIKRLNQLADIDKIQTGRNNLKNKGKQVRNAWEISYGEMVIGDTTPYSAEDEVNGSETEPATENTRTLTGEASGTYDNDIEDELEAVDAQELELDSQMGREMNNDINSLEEREPHAPAELEHQREGYNDDDKIVDDVVKEINIISDNFIVNGGDEADGLISRGYIGEELKSGGTLILESSKESSVKTNPWGGGRLRPRRAQPGDHAKKPKDNGKSTNAIVLAIGKIIKKNMSIKSAMDKLGNDAEEAITKEMTMIIKEKEVFEPVNINNLSFEERKTIIPSKLFLKEKYTATGEFDKLKARLVAGGHRQNKEVFENISSSTVNTASVMMITAIAAVERRSVAVVDFPGAYLNSVLPEDHPTVYMRLDKELSKFACNIDERYVKYIREDGTLIVKLKKALYGCVQSAKVWYDTLTGKLGELGYIKNMNDECVLNKTDKAGRQVSVVVHVDDILMTAANDASLKNELNLLESVFGELTIGMGPVVNYLGMVFNFNEPNGKVRITMKGFIEEFIKDMDGVVDGVSDTPAAKNLFEVGESSAIKDDDREFFHSTVARLLYLAKRVRPDLLVAVSYLAKRVQQPNDGDYNKLCKLIKYLRSSAELGIVLEADKLLSVIAYIDASHAIHENHRGHTGTIISLGRGPVYIKSSSQKINTKSSTETELVGLSDSASQVIWTRNFLLEQGYNMGPALVYQDNLSCMALVRNGKSNSDRTKHVATRFYFIKDRVDRKEIQIEHLGTESMIADILTKPLVGSLFLKLRSLLLNW